MTANLTTRITYTDSEYHSSCPNGLGWFNCTDSECHSDCTNGTIMTAIITMAVGMSIALTVNVMVGSIALTVNVPMLVGASIALTLDVTVVVPWQLVCQLH